MTPDEAATLLGHRFADATRLRTACTHPSFAHEHPDQTHYQRLEFLGDAVVNLCTTRMLVERYPNVPEGDLSDLRQRVVATRTLGEVGRAKGIAGHVRLGASEAGKAQVETKILGDVVEALFGALFLDGGLPPCQALAERWLGPRVDALRPDHAADVVRNAINRLQERTQATRGELPVYAFTWDGPDHDRTYTATVTIGGEVVAEGEGRSKKAATKRAAHLALLVLDRRGREAS